MGSPPGCRNVLHSLLDLQHVLCWFCRVQQCSQYIAIRAETGMSLRAVGFEAIRLLVYLNEPVR